MNRRSFLKTSLVGAGVAAGLNGLDSATSAQDRPAEKPKAVLKLGSQEGRLPGRSLKEKVENLVKYGGVGLELGAGTVYRTKEVQDAIAGTSIKIAAICAADGPYIVADEEQRKKAVANAKKLLTAAGELSSTGVIMVPSFNRKEGHLWGGEAHKVLVEMLKDLGEHAVKCNCRMLLEPLNKGEAWYLRSLAHAASICRDVNSDGVGLMGDFYHMNIEETSDMGAFISAGKYLHHVHLASRTRVMPGQDERSFVDGFRGLKMIGYQDFMSLECGCKRGTDPAEEIPKAFRFLEKQWEEATI
jgi:sugar phosphate isomerase/epimerase